MSGASPRPRIALLASRIGFEEKRILEALARHGLSCTHLDTRSLHREPDAAPAPWDAVLNREISATRALYAALALEAAGTKVLNSAAATETCGDKWRTSVALRRAGVPTPRTALALTPEAAEAAAEELGYPVVLKPLTGSWGRRVALLRDRDTARSLFEYCEAMPSPAGRLVYLQAYVDKPDRDIRVAVIGGRAVAAVYRRSADWRTNVARGATTEPCPLTDDLAKLGVAAADGVGAGIAGVDLVEDARGGLYVIEVNHRVEFAGLQAAAGDRVDIGAAIAGHLVEEAAR
ncbi:lysine biosynthesis protein LysX [Kitasatospora arboriphila]|uniref:Lysine biosynthesis protein LysX n=1 Tax=Kitasatospora arboriphila TaxID=258052 RepID=A0ABN1TGS5_9ACTN